LNFIEYFFKNQCPNPDKPEKSNHKHQISKKFQNTNSKYQILKNETILIFPVLMKISFSIRLSFFKIIYRFVFLDFGHWYLLVI